MTDIIIGIIVVVIIASATAYIIKAKRSGAKCIGCPSAKQCSSRSCGGCGCGSDDE